MAQRSYGQTQILAMCDLDFGDMTFGQGHGTYAPLALGHVIQLQHGSKELWLRLRLKLCLTMTLTLGDMTWNQGHGTSLDLRQQLYEMLSRSNMARRSYGPLRF